MELWIAFDTTSHEQLSNRFMKKAIVKTEKSLYIKILLWAYEKQEAGFEWQELEEEFGLTSAQDQWVLKVFRSSASDNENLLGHLNYNEKDDKHLFVITSKGTSAAVEYLNLMEAKVSSERAEKIALVAIVTGVIVGIFQIVIGLCQL